MIASMLLGLVVLGGCGIAINNSGQRSERKVDCRGKTDYSTLSRIVAYAAGIDLWDCYVDHDVDKTFDKSTDHTPDINKPVEKKISPKFGGQDEIQESPIPSP